MPEKKRKAKPESTGLNMLAHMTEYEASGINGIVSFFEKVTQEDLQRKHSKTSFNMVLPEPSYLENIGKTLTVTTTLKKESIISRCRDTSQCHPGQRRHYHP
jgi:hypothetical protein